MLNRTTTAGLAECNLDLDLRARLYYSKLRWVSSDYRLAPNAKHKGSRVETRVQKGAHDIVRGVYRVGVASRLPCVFEWAESGTRVVLALREASAICEERQSVSIGKQYAPSKEYVRSEWRQMGCNLVMNEEDRELLTVFRGNE